MTLVIAHRGASAAATENTTEAFALAGSLGADWVELDARRSADGMTVVHHDARLPDGRLIVETAAADLPVHVPTLALALDACVGLGVNIEIKNLPGDADFDPGEAVADAVSDEIARRGCHDSVLVSSFTLVTIDRVRELDQAIPTGLLVHHHDDVDRLAVTTRRHGHSALHPWDGLVDADLLTAARGQGLQVNVWTVDDPARMGELMALGVDGIVTNVPDVARRVVDSATGRPGSSGQPPA